MTWQINGHRFCVYRLPDYDGWWLYAPAVWADERHWFKWLADARLYAHAAAFGRTLDW
jgi:hypothetical protein